MCQIFHDPLGKDQHKKFQHWRATTLRGVLINLKSKVAGMIHRAACKHLGNTEWVADDGYGLTVSAKICSTNRDELNRWAKSNKVTLTICSHCMRD